MTPLGALRAPYLPPFSWSRQRGTIIAIAVFAATMIALQLITGQGIAYFDISSISASAATLALAALGETIVILAGGLDLSAGAVISLVNVVLVTQLGPVADMGTGLFTLVALWSSRSASVPPSARSTASSSPTCACNRSW